jgi:hypothetical protein
LILTSLAVARSSKAWRSNYQHQIYERNHEVAIAAIRDRIRNRTKAEGAPVTILAGKHIAAITIGSYPNNVRSHHRLRLGRHDIDTF